MFGKICGAANSSFHKYGAFFATLILFFLAEMGDKTQVATVILTAQYKPLFMVIIGTTLGMLLANVPIVFIKAASPDLWQNLSVPPQ